MAVRWRLHQSGSPNEDDPVVVHDVEVKHVQDGDSDDYVPTLDRELTDFLDSGWIKSRKASGSNHEEVGDAQRDGSDETSTRRLGQAPAL
ncbi:hypothetical protein C1H76_1150 [Elsinoe australis]|uniref:Uncharacterized protein n=1 Tax=Elsinoe australis TaxID=40998 RepID=A0A4U7B5F6_9PEZI|nr:hypothetical protein C1H76_1150 [Elsinoe australis]